MWWVWILAVVGSLAAVRTTVLSQVDDIQRARDECTLCTFDEHHYTCRQKSHKWFGLDTLQVIGVALLWPLILLYMVIKKAMFPRGLTTKFAKERRQEITLKARQRELEAEQIKVSEFCKEHGLANPYLLEEPLLTKAANPYTADRSHEGKLKSRVR